MGSAPWQGPPANAQPHREKSGGIFAKNAENQAISMHAVGVLRRYPDIDTAKSALGLAVDEKFTRVNGEERFQS
jgi:hypothetical protein